MLDLSSFIGKDERKAIKKKIKKSTRELRQSTHVPEERPRAKLVAEPVDIPKKRKSALVDRAGVDEQARSYVESLFKHGSVKVDELPEDFSPEMIIDAENEFDLIKLVNNAMDPMTGVPRNIKIPEGDFKEAKNFFDFCTNFRGTDAKFPFSRQMWLMLMLFAEVCPRCTDKKLFNILNLPVDAEPRDINQRLKLMDYGVCPKCGAHKSELTKNKELNEYVEMSLCIGQRAGKSTTTAAGTEYLTHKYLMYPKMSSICRGVSASTPLVATFVGYRFQDAYALLWDPIIKGIGDSDWFKSYHEMLDYYGKKNGIEFYRKKDLYLRYGHKNIELYPSGATKRSLRGRTRWLSVIDELGWFHSADDGAPDADRERADANGTYDALDRSLLTLREEVSYLYTRGHNRFLQAFAINISSPSSQGDKINRLVEENKDSDSILALRLPTWEVSPLLPRTSKRITNAYKKNPIEAERDYGANPPLNASVFIIQSEAERAFTGKNRASLSNVAKNISGMWRQSGALQVSAPQAPCPPTLVSLDAGLTNNSFAITVLNLETLNVNGIESHRINVPVMLEVQPKKGHMLHYPAIYKFLLKPLMKDFNTRFLFADRWNSIVVLDTAAEDFEGVGLIAKQYSVKYNDFITTRSYLEEDRLILPKLEMPSDQILRVDDYPTYFEHKPAAHLLFQMITVRDRGKTVLKGEGYTDDLFRALVLGVSRILDPKIFEAIKSMTAISTSQRITGAISAGRSGNLPGMPSIFGIRHSLQEAQRTGAATYLGMSGGGMQGVGALVNGGEVSSGKSGRAGGNSVVVRSGKLI